MAFLVSCAGDDGYEDNNKPTPTFRTRSELDDKIKSIPLTYCADQDACSASVGVTLLVHEEAGYVQSAQMAQCTGFLLEKKNLVAFNAHCLSDLIKENPGQCANYIAIKFPKEGSSPEVSRNCKRLINYSEHDRIPGTIMDYAIIEIDPVDREPFQISDKPVQVNDQLKVIKVDPGQYSIEGRMDINYCRVQGNSLLNMDYLGPYSETLLAVEYPYSEYPDYSYRCTITKGNSGSPILNSDGELVGIIQSGVTQAMIGILRHWNKVEIVEGISFDFDRYAEVPNNLSFTNAQCLEFAGRSPHPECEEATLDDNTFIRAVLDAYAYASEITDYTQFRENFGIPEFVHMSYKYKGEPEDRDSETFRSDYTQSLQKVCFEEELFQPFFKKSRAEEEPLYSFHLNGYSEGNQFSSDRIELSNAVVEFMIPQKFRFKIKIPLSKYLELETDYEYVSGVQEAARIFVEIKDGEVLKVYKESFRFRGDYGPGTFDLTRGQTISRSFREVEEIDFEFCTTEFIEALRRAPDESVVE